MRAIRAKVGVDKETADRLFGYLCRKRGAPCPNATPGCRHGRIIVITCINPNNPQDRTEMRMRID